MWVFRTENHSVQITKCRHIHMLTIKLAMRASKFDANVTCYSFIYLEWSSDHIGNFNCFLIGFYNAIKIGQQNGVLKCGSFHRVLKCVKFWLQSLRWACAIKDNNSNKKNQKVIAHCKMWIMVMFSFLFEFLHILLAPFISQNVCQSRRSLNFMHKRTSFHVWNPHRKAVALLLLFFFRR